ncbi:MAG: GntR family transcriptional regulator [Prevotella sp.]|nr:GntR family transcriptional regulator [Prevotella sp.]MBQ6210992.1 GntR family transcriptional regulator [Prevotella sp.]
MAFNTDKAIFLQMADRVCDEILSGKYGDDDRIPSVRDYAVMLEVNTNTAMKAYEQLARENIIYNKRGLGYYVTPGAREQILAKRRHNFMSQQLPELFRQMELLRLDIEDVVSAYEKVKD